ncbi:galactokinase [Ruminiclostridium cellulolyticum]|uniref:Galactokinase n=1 Tax=Ruminiclostridium cellulolyticum (strain ATCC 35319 / DSM 5812 / JCM 6584 / H10) TaxID=394503 RepID=B8I0X2_RUMCH|nr:galactokinase [Ruminiclostridium cellulolyticum]ACL77528.1 galactokinase [Ruminiclostridium cellulolyticum H10]
MQKNYDELKKKFCRIYGGSEEDLRIFSGPGRVNLIGEHIDYCGGFVFPAALSLDSTVIARINNDNTLRVAATDLPDRVEVELDKLESAKSLKWGNYQAGVAFMLQDAGYRLVGVDMLFHDTVPLGSGLSSSAAIELATAVTLVTLSNEVYGITKPIDMVEMAVLGQRTENEFCGVSCGIMDQFASAMGKKDHAILLDCGTLEYKYLPLKLDGYKIVLGNTKKKRALGESKYNERVRECAEGLKILQKYLPNKRNLCDITVSEFEQYKSMIEDEVIKKRVTHVISENDRVLRAAEALKRNDLEELGRLLVEANDSIRDLYEVTGKELDTMTAEAMKVEGVLGARMTGAGFGGCTVNIVPEDKVDLFIQQVGENYKEQTGITPEFYVSEISDGAREIKI